MLIASQKNDINDSVFILPPFTNEPLSVSLSQVVIDHFTVQFCPG